MNHDKTMQTTPLESFPPLDQWDDWTELDAKAWPRKVEKHYTLVPTTCFNCEAACGLVAYVDKETQQVKRLEGNPHHPGSRGKNCAKGPATLNQIEDPERILYPMKRVGPRGSGKYERTTWDEVLDVFATKIRTALQEGRRKEIMYHVGRPGADGYMDRVLQSWGIDGHNSHTNVCSGAARLGYATWTGADRPSPDHAHAKFMLMLSSHLETGHYFNPHAQRITEARMAGTKMAVCDVRLSNTASLADYWLAPFPGTEAIMLLAMAHILLEEQLYNAEFVRTWVNWEDTLKILDPDAPVTFDNFIDRLKQHYAYATPEAAEKESGVPAAMIVDVAHEIGKAGTAFATHVWRNAASGNLGGWQVARCLEFLCVLMGSVGAKGGTNLNSSDKFVAAPFVKPPPQEVWNELLYPLEWPLSHHELSFILPHLMEDQGAKISTYFTRVYNPVWTNPDGMVWEQLLRDESKVELHAALTPTWNETAQYADYVLPMGLGAERHDLMSQETHSAKWISFRQPVARVAMERMGQKVEWTHEANPGEVWEEDEFWIALSWKIDPDGSLGIRKYYESPYRPGERITIDEYYQWIFENSVPGLPAAAAKQDLTPLEYMRRHGAFLVKDKTYSMHMQGLGGSGSDGSDGSGGTEATDETDDTGTVRRDGVPVGVVAEGQARTGFHTPSRKLELYSQTIADWGWPEYALPCYIESHVHRKHMDISKGEFALVPTFRLPTLIHTRSGNSKWLLELSNTNPVWLHPEDAARMGVETCDLVRVSTRIGHFVNKVWVTEAMRPGVVACSHHLGRWRLSDQEGRQGGSYSEATVEREELSPGTFRFRRIQGLKAFESADPDTSRIWWTDGGVHQNLTFPVQPDPVSGMHCWHQCVTVEPAHEGDRYADVVVDTTRSREVYREWKANTRPAPGPGGLRRPLHFARAVKPSPAAYRV